MKPWLVLVVAILLVGGVTAAVVARRSGQPQSIGADQPTVSDAAVESTNAANPEPPAPTTRRLVASEIDGVASEFRWSAEVPAGWQAEAVPAIEAINLYDPTASGDSNLEKSQIFIRHFSGSDFLTLSTVTIHDRKQEVVDDRPAVRYEIEKKPGVASFPNQPSWRSARHIVTDVRVSDTNPSVFYVIAKRPDLSDSVYARFLATLQVTGETAGLVPPVDDLRARVTKKPFGIQVSPTSSPVQPERFQGLHTGIDVEFGDSTPPNGSDGAGLTGEVSVRAISDGTVLLARTADGYGGVVVVKHVIDGKDRAVIYGHLDPEALPKVGDRVNRGDKIGRLGEGGTAETDGERKHLHFGIRTDESIDLSGYVDTEAALKHWLDPLTVL